MMPCSRVLRAATSRICAGRRALVHLLEHFVRAGLGAAEHHRQPGARAGRARCRREKRRARRPAPRTTSGCPAASMRSRELPRLAPRRGRSCCRRSAPSPCRGARRGTPGARSALGALTLLACAEHRDHPAELAAVTGSRSTPGTRPSAGRGRWGAGTPRRRSCDRRGDGQLVGPSHFRSGPIQCAPSAWRKQRPATVFGSAPAVEHLEQLEEGLLALAAHQPSRRRARSSTGAGYRLAKFPPQTIGNAGIARLDRARQAARRSRAAAPA